MAKLKEVLQEEKNYRVKSRQTRLEKEGLKDSKAPPIGLAFSGGGIRSATFNLGLIQSFAQHKLLHYFDYLSTVSGGGYIGSWLMAWMYNQRFNSSRQDKSPIHDAEWEFGVKPYNPLIDNERPAVRFLRYYSRYLSPQRGLLSADPWTLLATYLRNTVLNFAIFSAVLVFLLLVPRWIMAACIWLCLYIPDIHGLGGIPIRALLIGSVFACVSMWYMGRNLASTPFSHEKLSGEFPRFTHQGWVQITCVSTLFIACSIYSMALHSALEYNAKHFIQGYLSTETVDVHFFSIHVLSLRLFLVGAASYVILCGGTILLGSSMALKGHTLIASLSGTSSKAFQIFMRKLAGWSVAAAIISGLLLMAVGKILGELWRRADCLWLVLGLGTCLLIGVLQVTAAFHIGMMGHTLPDELHEWLTRFGAWTMIYNVVWLTAFSFVVYVPVLVQYVIRSYPIFSTIVILIWIGLVLSGVLVAKGVKTGVSTFIQSFSAAQLNRIKNAGLTMLARSSPYLFIVGVLSFFAVAIARLPAMSLAANDLIPAPSGIVERLFALTVACMFGAAFLGWRVDVNEFSMHQFYRNRLVRCYLGASAEKRKPQPFTAFDPADDILLSSFAQDERAGWPYLIINTALNVVRGKDALALQTRKAKSFIFSPLYCGYDRSKYAPTNPREFPAPKLTSHSRRRGEVAIGGGGQAAQRVAEVGADPKRYLWPEIHPETDEIFEATSNLGTEPETYGRTEDCRKKCKGGISLGTAMAISGAAASPNMGYHTSTAASFFLSLFNIRLGEWMGNPKNPKAWMQGTPRFGLYWLLSELFGNTTDESSFLYLSDGGHFENLGIYELIRRRCCLIVASDAASDPERQFADLANAIERCRADFGVSITFKTGAETESLIMESFKDVNPSTPGLRWVRQNCGQDKGLRSFRSGLDALRPDNPHPLPIAIAEIDYGGSQGIFIYIKPTLLEDLPPDVHEYARLHRSGFDKFPQQSTMNQLFDEVQFECYRTLGTRTGDEVETVIRRVVQHCLTSSR